MGAAGPAAAEQDAHHTADGSQPTATSPSSSSPIMPAA
jgi:hypothetical protein